MSINPDNHQGHEWICTEQNTTHPVTYAHSMEINVLSHLYISEHIAKCISYAAD